MASVSAIAVATLDEPPAEKVKLVTDLNEVPIEGSSTQTESSNPAGYTTLGNAAYFSATKDGASYEIFVYKEFDVDQWDARAVPNWSSAARPSHLTAHMEWCYFVDSGTHVKRTDGTQVESITMAEAFPPLYGLVSTGGSLFALSRDDEGSIAVWSIDHETGEVSTVAQSSAGQGYPVSGSFVNCGFGTGSGFVAFVESALPAGEGEHNMWKWDHSSDSLSEFGSSYELFSATGSYSPVQSGLYLEGSRSGIEDGLFYFDGTGSSQVAYEGIGLANVKYMTTAGDMLYFALGLDGDETVLRAEEAVAYVVLLEPESVDVHGMANQGSNVWILATIAGINSIWKATVGAEIAYQEDAELPGGTGQEHFIATSRLAWCMTDSEEEYRLCTYAPLSGTATTAPFEGLFSPTTVSAVTGCGDRVLLTCRHSDANLEPWHYPAY